MQFVPIKKRSLLLAFVYAVILFLIAFTVNLSVLNQWFLSVLLILRPVLIGLGFAYLSNGILTWIETRLLFKMQSGSLRRAIGILLTDLFLVAILFLMFFMIIPQLLDSISTFVNHYDSFVSNLLSEINNIIDFLNQSVLSRGGENYYTIEPLDEAYAASVIEKFFSSLHLDQKSLSEFLISKNLGMAFEFAGNALKLVADCVIGLFISIYLLASKEKRYAQVMRIRRAFFDDRTNAKMTEFFSVADRSFGGFLIGKILDSAIIGLLTFLITTIFSIPYALLVSVFVGITNIIPVIGPIIGAIPTSLIILLTDPSKVIPFIIIIIIIQQLDGNVIGPKILGENTGVSALCVMIAVTSMGTLWGLSGMILGVPIFATILTLVDRDLEARLKEKGLPSSTEDYLHDAHSEGLDEVEEEKEAYNGDDILENYQKFQRDTYELAKKYKIFPDEKAEPEQRFPISGEQDAEPPGDTE